MPNVIRRIVPFSASYDQAENHFRVSKCLTYIIVTIAVALSISEQYDLTIAASLHLGKLAPALKNLIYGLGYLNGVLVGAYLYFEYRGGYLFNRAEMKRRLDFVDNTFGTKFSEENSADYYTNDNIDGGIYKMAVNNFENCMTTHYSLSYMWPRVLTRNLILLILFIFAAAFGAKNIVRIIAESLVAATLVLELVKVWVYDDQVEGILGKWRTVFQNLDKSNISATQTAQLIMAVLEYETTLAWASIPLDSKYFWKNREALAQKWIEQKTRYNIK